MMKSHHAYIIGLGQGILFGVFLTIWLTEVYATWY